MKSHKINNFKQLRTLIQEMMSENPNLMNAPEPMSTGSEEMAPDDNAEEPVQSPEELISKIKDLISGYEASKNDQLDGSREVDDII